MTEEANPHPPQKEKSYGIFRRILAGIMGAIGGAVVGGFISIFVLLLFGFTWMNFLIPVIAVSCLVAFIGIMKPSMGFFEAAVDMILGVFHAF